jgi:uncharacterized protein (DUF1499 family)
MLQKLIRDFTTNVAVLDPAADDPLLQPLTLACSTEAVADRIATWAESTPLWKLETRDEREDSITLHLTRTTRLFRFVDDIYITLSGEGGQTNVAAESRSRLGKGDLGQNPRNLKELTRMLQPLT